MAVGCTSSPDRVFRFKITAAAQTLCATHTATPTACCTCPSPARAAMASRYGWSPNMPDACEGMSQDSRIMPLHTDSVDEAFAVGFNLKTANSPQRTQGKNKTLVYVWNHPLGDGACCANHLSFFVFSVSSVVQLFFSGSMRGCEAQCLLNRGKTS